MAEIITCPHCGKLESWRGTEHTHCAFCKQSLHETRPRALDSLPATKPPATRVLRMTVLGGLWGGGIAAAIWLFFFAFPVLQAVGGTGDFPDADAGGSPSSLLMATMGGVAEGACLMALASVAFYRQPRAARNNLIGGVIGALVSPLFVLPIAAILAPHFTIHPWPIFEASAAVCGLVGWGILFGIEGMRIAACANDE